MTANIFVRYNLSQEIIIIITLNEIYEKIKTGKMCFIKKVMYKRKRYVMGIENRGNYFRIGI